MNKRHYEHTLPNIRGSLSNTYDIIHYCFNKYTNYQTFIILPLFYIPQKSVELSPHFVEHSHTFPVIQCPVYPL